jgi:hypothetical protein
VNNKAKRKLNAQRKKGVQKDRKDIDRVKGISNRLEKNKNKDKYIERVKN